VYEKHIKPLKQLTQVPVVSSILAQVTTVLASVQTRILANIQKTKSPSFDMLRRSIDQLLSLECLPEPVDFCLTYIHSLLNTRLARSFTKAKTAAVAWLLPTSAQSEALRDLLPVVQAGPSVEVLVLKVVSKATSLLHTFQQLLTHYYSPSQLTSKHSRLQSMLQETASILCSNLQDCVTGQQDLDTKGLCEGMSKLAEGLKGTEFDQFFGRFLEGHVERHFRTLEQAMGQFHLREVWALDLQNPAGTALPRLCYCHCLDSLSALHSQLPPCSVQALSPLHHYLQTCLLAFLASMLRSSTAQETSRLSANQRLLRVASNLQYFKEKIAESVFEAANGLFGRGETLEDCRPMVEVWHN